MCARPINVDRKHEGLPTVFPVLKWHHAMLTPRYEVRDTTDIDITDTDITDTDTGPMKMIESGSVRDFSPFFIS